MNDVEEILRNHFSKYLDDDVELTFVPTFIGREKCDPRKPVTWQKENDQYTFHYILDGEGYLSVHGKSVKLKANDVFFIPPKCDYMCYYPDKKNPWEYVWFHLKGSSSKNLASCAKLTAENNYYSVQNSAALRAQMCEMIDVAKNTVKRNASYYLPYVMKFFAEIADERKISATNLTSKERNVKKILDIIEENYSRTDFSVRKVADALFYSVSYVSKIFKEVTNMTPVEYVESLRMLKAKDMLLSGKYTVNQIAFDVGYASQFYFSKVFKGYFGVAPSRFAQDGPTSRA